MKKIFLATFVFMFLLGSVWVMAEKAGYIPVAVSPGSETEAVTVWQSCPTFSWSAVDQASSYRVAVFESVDANVSTYEAIAALSSPVVSKEIPGPALSWTLPAEQKLKTGGRYAWYVQALDAAGNALGSWSGGRIFKVEQEVRFAGITEKLGDILKSYGVKEETVTNVLEAMKSEVQEVVVSGTGGKETPVMSGIKGLEGATNTFYGSNAGASIDTGTGNSFFGNSAGFYTDWGFENTFLGARAGYYNTTGHWNTFVGFYTGYSNTSGIDNVFLGLQAGLNNSTGNKNVFLGKYAGYTNTTASYNTFIGNEAGYGNTSGHDGVFLGHYAGYSNTTGYRNNFLGGAAGYSNTTGNYNTFLGNEAGYSNTVGYYNTFLGNGAGGSNVSGDYNTFLGNFTGYFNTGNYNTYLGNLSGYNNTTGSNNIFLGYRAGYSETGSYKLYIDSSSTSSPLIYGEFDNDIVTINGKLGIGTAPSYPLHMASGAYCTVGGTWTNASSRSLKENIQSLSTGEAVEALNKLNPVKYNYKADKTDRHVGFIAEDVPDLVATADRKGLSPMDVTAVLTKVVQELKRENQEQQDLIQKQQEMNQEYKKIISALQERMAKLEKK